MKKRRAVFFSTLSLPLPDKQEKIKTPEEERIERLLRAVKDQPGRNPLRAMEEELNSWPRH